MFPFNKNFIVIGEPMFDDPTIKYPRFGKDLEAIVARQGIRFGETGLYSPIHFLDYKNPHFEYRIFKGKTTASEYESIDFDYFPSEGSLQVSAPIPEALAQPIVDFIAASYLGVIIQEEAHTTKDVILQCRCTPPSLKRFEMAVNALSHEITSSLEKGDYDIQNQWWMKACLEILTQRPRTPDKAQKGPMRIGFDYPDSVRIAEAAQHLYESLYAWISECHPEQFDSYRRDYNTLAGQTLDLFENLSSEEDWVYALFTLCEPPHGEKYYLYNPQPFTRLLKVCMKHKSHATDELQKNAQSTSEPPSASDFAPSSHRPRNLGEAISQLHAEEQEQRKRRWFAIRDKLNDSGLTIPIEQWPFPENWQGKMAKYPFNHLRELIHCALLQISNEDNAILVDDKWEFLMPTILSLDLGCYTYSPMETYDDGIYKTVTLQDGSSINISRQGDSSYLCFQPRDMCVYEIERYIRAGVEISRKINSQSNRTWRKAEMLFNKKRTLINLPQSEQSMKELAELLHAARTDLLIDIEDYDHAPDQPQPVMAEVVALTPETLESVGTQVTKSVAAALRSKVGRPPKTSHGSEHYTQKALAAMLNTACNCTDFTESIIHDWEHKRSQPPTAWANGELVTYSAEIRKFPNKGNNRTILEAIIKELKTSHKVSKSVLQKDKVHCRTPETLAKASGQTAAAIRERSKLKYEK